MHNLKNLKNAQKLIEDLEASEPIMPDHEFGGVGDSPSPEQPETEGEEALDLLREIAGHLETLVDAEVGDEEAEADDLETEGAGDSSFGDVEVPAEDDEAEPGI